MTDQAHPDDDLILDVALGGTDDQARDRVAEHLTTCERCRRSHEELVRGVDLAVPAVPRTAPPPGFETRVLDRLRDLQGSRDRHGDGGRRTPRWLPVVAAGLLGVAVGVGGTRVVDDSSEPAAAVTWDAPLVTGEGNEVGGVSRGHGPAGAQLVVVLSDATAGSVYRCRAVLGDGTVRDLARWDVSGYDDDLWVIDEPLPGVRTVELLDESGDVWASAAL